MVENWKDFERQKDGTPWAEEDEEEPPRKTQWSRYWGKCP